ncbi:SH3 domain-containing protein [Neobacillus mesonae]|uniref:SH3 domain-containing protein n=1 Tax=Neobacillus mesonae TaxID=1193713 RepID=UPI00203DFBB4|nr:SH3 domain-containing protein [Neobacillus mesonae]MCM3571081.1 SH3 domain-containing protein [Neobacillus mesonae]
MKKFISYFLAILLIISGFTSISGLKVHAAGKTKYVTATVLNVRQSATTKSKIMTTIKKNTAVTVTQTKSGWDRVSVNKKTGWVSNKYLTTKKPAASKAKVTNTFKKTAVATTKSYTKYVTATVLNVRQSATTKSKVVTTIKKNTAVTVTQTKSGWDKVSVNKKTGWVSNKYLTTKKPAAPKNLAEGLKTVGGNKQLILVTSNGYNTTNSEIRTFEKNSKGQWVPVFTTTGHIGKYGFTPASSMREGGKKSPTGKYTIGTAFGQYANPGTKLPYKKITSDDVWVDDPKSKLYNTWQSKRKTIGKWKSAENMNIAAYNYGFVINYNTARTPYKGSAIFFHVGSGYTLGCTDTTQAGVVKILKWLDPAKKPVIIQTPIQELNKY